MSKPDWKDAPDWANYMAMDEDGEWFWFQLEPEHGSAAWLEFGGQMESAGYLGLDWKESKEKRP